VPGLRLVEWPDKAEGLLPVPALVLHIEPTSETARTVRLHGTTALGQQVAAGLRAQPEELPT
jgi:tRNA threonylcarbamoyladenosine biosynthesis protein TsaE